MKNLFVYYLVAMIILVPLIYWAFKTQTGYFPVGLLFFYLIVYRGFTDSFRLIQKRVIGMNEIWKMFTGFGQVTWFNKLYLEK